MQLRIAGALVILTVSLSCATQPSLPSSSELTPRASPVQVGETAPNLTLEDQHHQRVALAAARGNAPTVLVFYRGNW